MPCQEPCDDGNANTGNDAWDSKCNCSGQVVDCAGVAGGSAFIDQCGVCAGGSTGNVPNADSDGDGLLDCEDNCKESWNPDGRTLTRMVWVMIAITAYGPTNPDQSDADGDGIGGCVRRLHGSRRAGLRSGHGDIPESGPRDGAHIDRGSRVKRLSLIDPSGRIVLDVQRTTRCSWMALQLAYTPCSRWMRKADRWRRAGSSYSSGPSWKKGPGHAGSFAQTARIASTLNRSSLIFRLPMAWWNGGRGHFIIDDTHHHAANTGNELFHGGTPIRLANTRGRRVILPLQVLTWSRAYRGSDRSFTLRAWCMARPPHRPLAGGFRPRFTGRT